jgi:predicted phage terminase large subunit-like protein
VLRNGVTIEALGTGQRIRGRRRREHRPTLIVCDDLQNDGHANSILQREHSRNWFHGALMKAGTARTNVVNLATALHRDALAMELHRTPGWISHVFKAIVRWPENMSLWQQWEAVYADPSKRRYKKDARAFYERNRAAMDAGSIVLWPEEEDLYALMCMRVESGRTAFEREKQNSPINPDLCEWPEAYFDETIWFNEWPGQLAVKTLALDPSKGADSRRGDYSALVALGVDRQGTLYVEADLARRPTPAMVADGAEWFRRFQPDLFGVEANQFQDLLAGEFEAEFRRAGILAARPIAIENHTSKQVRIRRLGPYLSSRRLRFKSGSPGTRLLVEQLQEFPIADHDDGPDALEMALRLAVEIFRGRAVRDGLGNRLPVGE